VADPLLGLVAHPLAVVAHVFGEALRALPLAREELLVLSRLGVPGGLPAKRGGISIIALLISTATGFRSLAWASSPSRCASSGRFRTLGSRVSLQRCEDRSFLRLAELLRGWFGVNQAT
jgi:hypothetical protein